MTSSARVWLVGPRGATRAADGGGPIVAVPVEDARASRLTDAAVSGRAQCVVLNRGPHIVEAIGVLDSILTRMQDHQHKKRSLLRRLRAWDHADSTR